MVISAMSSQTLLLGADWFRHCCWYQRRFWVSSRWCCSSWRFCWGIYAHIPRMEPQWRSCCGSGWDLTDDVLSTHSTRLQQNEALLVDTGLRKRVEADDQTPPQQCGMPGYCHVENDQSPRWLFAVLGAAESLFSRTKLKQATLVYVFEFRVGLHLWTAPCPTDVTSIFFQGTPRYKILNSIFSRYFSNSSVHCTWTFSDIRES